MRKKMRKEIGVVFLVLAVTGCVSTQNVPVTEDTVTDMNGKSLAVAKRDKPDFVAMTAGKAAFGLIGAGAMVGAGNKIVQENSVDDQRRRPGRRGR
jgi:hypothetical protein